MVQLAFSKFIVHTVHSILCCSPASADDSHPVCTHTIQNCIHRKPICALLNSGSIPPPVILLATYYIKAANLPEVLGNNKATFVTAYIMAAKFSLDVTTRNSQWAKIAGIDVFEINHLEWRMLKALDFNLYLSEQGFIHWIRTLDPIAKSVKCQSAPAITAVA